MLTVTNTTRRKSFLSKSLHLLLQRQRSKGLMDITYFTIERFVRKQCHLPFIDLKSQSLPSGWLLFIDKKMTKRGGSAAMQQAK